MRTVWENGERVAIKRLSSLLTRRLTCSNSFFRITSICRMLGDIFRWHTYYPCLVLVLFSAIRVIRAILGQRPRGLIRPIPTRFRYSFPVLYRQPLVHRRQPSLSDSIRIYLPECLAMRSASRRPQDKRPPAVSSAPQHSRQFVQAAANRGSTRRNLCAYILDFSLEYSSNM